MHERRQNTALRPSIYKSVPPLNCMLGGTLSVVARSIVLAVVLVLSGCGPVPEIETRFTYWSRETDLFFEQARTMDDLHGWLRARGIVYTFDDTDIVDGKWAMTFEKIYPDTVRCEWVDIQLNVAVDDMHQIQTHSLSRNRACWW